ncbi:hypothetical protein F3Y22_tig00116976pilonHSYRG00171 [Hibiscus syriacus]|uniref:Uncharacterized protein n=1 Tax=Hibiscus syriacus TaxID=106335 RepID=A0A6A2X7B3_HIBSY|nr:hypothetical protein F3Y22_tig00116976pilonHSYRG00171 [Hibiscus syriacus]
MAKLSHKTAAQNSTTTASNGVTKTYGQVDMKLIYGTRTAGTNHKTRRTSRKSSGFLGESRNTEALLDIITMVDGRLDWESVWKQVPLSWYGMSNTPLSSSSLFMEFLKWTCICINVFISFSAKRKG